MWSLLFVLLVGCGGSEATAEAPHHEVAPEKAKTAAGKREDVSIADFVDIHAKGVTLIDVRTTPEVKAGHVPGIVHVPVSEVGPDHPKLKGLSKTDPIYFICAVGGRSGKAADLMSEAGFHTVNVVGGTNAWMAEGHPVEKE